MQGFNMGRYYPPPESGESSNAPFNKTHPLGARARKLKTQGILTVRFEMPFAIWCSTCPKPTIIGQGVRFNAEKKKVGNYFSTPIWSFRMKHAICGGAIEIRTDPQATEYVVFEGAKRRDYGEDRVVAEQEGNVVIDEAERARRREDAMAGLEGKKEEEVVKKDSKRRIEELQDDRDKWWSDPYSASRMVRKSFRTERKERHHERDKAEEIQSRLGLDIDLLPTTEQDSERARLVDFGSLEEVDALSRPLFEGSHQQKTIKVDSSGARTTKAERARARAKQKIQQNLRASIHASMDPFTKSSSGSKHDQSAALNSAASLKNSQSSSLEDTKRPSTPLLVTYDSD